MAQLRSDKESIEAEIGSPLQWLELPGKKQARIVLEAPINPRVEGNLQAVKEWMYEKAKAFYVAFRPRVLKLTPPAGLDADEKMEDEDIDTGPDAVHTLVIDEYESE